ncbi:Protein of unknown function [Pyronema omphalodes CBS 100304]|uniref:Uncharacterized protein n=1 Tax=Pyronema omphalodes (strain CBS 100304) TaxID=1076935 RepID=U4LT28_PYROM|nr:Protein of unknown function [Pyronema omphalodes CBS 100304]
MNSRLQHLFLFLFALLFTSVLAAPEAIPEALAAPEAFPEALAEPEALPEPIPQGSGAGGNPEGRPDTPRQTFRGGDHGPGECRILGQRQSCYRRPYVNSMRVRWVQGRVKFDCWYWNGSEYWDRTSSGCWVQERYIESGCWRDLRRCRNV